MSHPLRPRPDDKNLLDLENPPCPACFAFDMDPTLTEPVTPEMRLEERRLSYAAGMTTGFLLCRTRSQAWKHMCQDHAQAAQQVVDMVCADFGFPREKVYADLGLAMPEPASVQRH